MKDLDFMARAIEIAKKGQLKVQPNPMVGCVIVKSDGERQPFNGVKLKGGMLRALEKRPLSSEEVDGVFGSILTEIRQLGEREIASRQLGEIVMRNLTRVDQVAYVRFASVYRDFQDIKEFAEEISSLSKEKTKRTKKKK